MIDLFPAPFIRTLYRPLAGLFFFVLFLSAWPPEAGAQEQRFAAAVLGGFNLSQVDGDDLAGYHKIGLAAGGRVAAILHPRWRLAMEMQFVQQGSRRGKGEFNGTLDRIQLNFVEVPVMVQFLEWKFRVNAGFSYGRLINYRVIDLSGAEVSEQYDYDPNQFFVQGGVTFLFSDHWGIDLRLSRALTNLQRDGTNGRLITRNITLRALYAF